MSGAPAPRRHTTLAPRVTPAERRTAWALLGVAFGVRVLWVCAVRLPLPDRFDDVAWYHFTAILLAQGRGYLNPVLAFPTVAWPPGYPALLAIVYAIFGPRPLTGALLNAVAGTVSCFCAWQLGRVLVSERGGLVALALMAFFPTQVFFNSLLMSETVFTAALSALVLGGVLLFERARRRESALGWLWWGMAAGAATLVRSEGAALVAVPALAAGSQRVRRRATVIASAAALGAALALAPWAWRNAVVAGAFVPTSASLGRTLLIGHNPAATGGMMAIEDRPGEPAPRGARDEVDRDRRMIRAAFDFARRNPGMELGLVPRKVYRLFRGDHEWLEWYGERSGLPPRLMTLLGRLSNLYYGVVMLLGAVGWIAWWRSPRAGRRLIQLVVMCWVVVFALIYGSPRFHHPLVPLFCVMAADALTSRAARVRSA